MDLGEQEGRLVMFTDYIVILAGSYKKELFCICIFISRAF